MKFLACTLAILISISGYLLLRKDPVISAVSSPSESNEVVGQVAAVAKFMGQNEEFQKQMHAQNPGANVPSGDGIPEIDHDKADKIQSVYSELRTMVGQQDATTSAKLQQLMSENPEEVESFFRSYFVAGAINEGPSRYRSSLELLFSAANINHQPEYLDILHIEVVRNFNSPDNEFYQRYTTLENRPGQVDLMVEQSRTRAANGMGMGDPTRAPASGPPGYPPQSEEQPE